MNRIKELRTGIGMSQQELANYLKITRLTLSNYEKGKTEPGIHVLIKIATYFDVTIDYLVGRKK